jgi:hypothetical protein
VYWLAWPAVSRSVVSLQKGRVSRLNLDGGGLLFWEMRLLDGRSVFSAGVVCCLKLTSKLVLFLSTPLFLVCDRWALVAGRKAALCA